MNTVDLYRLRAEHNGAHTWNVGLAAELEVIKACDSGGFYLVAVPQLEEGLKLLGLPLRFDRSLPKGRIELRDADGRVLGAIEDVGDV